MVVGRGEMRRGRLMVGGKAQGKSKKNVRKER